MESVKSVVASDNVKKDGMLTGSLPELLHRSRQAEYREAYMHEYHPVGPTEHSIVRELASHTAAIDLWNEAIGAIERQGAMELPAFADLAGKNGSRLRDAVLAGTMSQEAVDRCEKNLRSHSRAFTPPSENWRSCRRRQKLKAGELIIPPNPFTTATACESYLVERFKTGKCRCPRCGALDGCHIAGRAVGSAAVVDARPGCGTAP